MAFQMNKDGTVPQIFATLLLLAICVLHSSATYEREYMQRDGLHVPCSYFETVNVTGDTKFANGSFLHGDVLIPPHYVGLYNYVYRDLIRRYEVEAHYRGCICKLKPCVNFCCPWGTKHNSSMNSCEPTSAEFQWPDPLINITMSNGTLQTFDLFKQFEVQQFRPCDQMYSLQPELEASDGWSLFQNGTMLRFYDMAYLQKDEYCLVPTLMNDSDTLFIINPANCWVADEDNTIKIINAYAMLFSIPFMLLTIFVYLLIPELRNQHGKSLVCYLLGLCIGYSLLCYNSLSDSLTVTDSVECKVLGYTAYYFFMAAFLWLSVISFDLWHNFRGTRGVNRFQEKKRFLLYSLYAWGLAAVFLVLTWFAQEMADIPEYLRPGIGNDFCWLNVHTWSAMIYFFGPIILLILANIIMFVMTALKIHHVQREMARIMAREDSTRNLRTEKDKYCCQSVKQPRFNFTHALCHFGFVSVFILFRFGLFLRLFIVMGVTWSMEIISYFVGTNKPFSKIFYIPDICNAIQGFLIFMLFVMKKKVKHLITNRILKCGSPGTSQTNSTNSTTSVLNSNFDKSIKMKQQTQQIYPTKVDS